MFSGLIGALRVDLGVNSAVFKKALADAQGSFAQFRGGMQGIGAGLRGIGTGMTAAVTAPMLAAGAAVGAATDSLVALADQSRVAKMSAQDFKTLAIAAGQYGVEQEALSGILKDVNDRVGEFTQTGGGPMADFFENIAPKVGVTADMFRELSGGDALGLYVSSLEKAGVSQQEMTFYLEAMAGDASKLVPVFANNGKVLKQVTDRARGLGLVINGDLLEGARAARADFAVVSEVLGVQLQQALVQLAPAFQQLLVAALPAIEGVVRAVSGVAAAFAALSPSAQGATVAIAGIAAAAGPVLIVAGALVSAIATLATPIGLIVLGVAGVAAGVTYLVTQWDELLARFPAIGQGIALAGVAFQPLSQIVGLVADSLLDLARVVFAVINGDWAGAWSAAKDIAGNASEAINIALAGMPARVGAWIEETAAALAAEMHDLAAQARDWGIAIVDGLVAGLKARVASARDAVVGLGDDVSGWFKGTLGIHSPSRVFRVFGENTVEGFVEGVEGEYSSAERAVKTLGERLAEVGSRAGESVSEALIGGLASGDIAGGAKQAWSDVVSSGQSAWGEVLSDAFSGGGLKSITGSISGAFKGVSSALSGGLSFAGIGSAISSALPVIGMVSSVVSLIKGFSSKTTTAAGMALSVTDGELTGGNYTTVVKKKFWGLVKSTSTSLTAFDAETQAAFSAQAQAVRDAVSQTYAAAGAAIEAGFVDGFDYSFGKISTMGKTEDQISAELTAAFTAYGDAISEAVGGVSLELAAGLAEVRAILDPVGGMLYGTFAGMAQAASELSGLFGGSSGLSSAVSSFVSTYYSDAERLDMLSGQVAEVFAGLGVSIPQTLAGFRELVLSQDLMTEAGRSAYAALLGVSSGFAQVVGAAEAAAAALGSAFDVSNSWLASEYDARLAQVADVRGYGFETVVASSAGTTQYGRSALTGDGAAVQILSRLLGVFDAWDAEGMPAQRSF